MIDPPGDECPSDRPEKPERVGQREWRVRNDAEFGRTTRLISEAKVLAFAGADQATVSKFERARTRIPMWPRSAPRDIETAENELGTFRGIRQRVGLKDRFNIDVFQALDTRVYDAMLSEEPARTDEQLRCFQARSAASSVNIDGGPVRGHYARAWSRSGEKCRARWNVAGSARLTTLGEFPVMIPPVAEKNPRPLRGRIGGRPERCRILGSNCMEAWLASVPGAPRRLGDPPFDAPRMER